MEAIFVFFKNLHYGIAPILIMGDKVGKNTKSTGVYHRQRYY